MNPWLVTSGTGTSQGQPAESFMLSSDNSALGYTLLIQFACEKAPAHWCIIKRGLRLNSRLRIELQTSRDNTPARDDFSKANLFNNLLPSAILSVDIMHNSADPACDVPIPNVTNQELTSLNSLTNRGETVLPPMQPVNTHYSSLRFNAGHTESGGGENSELDPSLANYEVLCEQLFESIQNALVLDECTNSPEKREKMHLHLHNELLWNGKLLVHTG